MELETALSPMEAMWTSGPVFKAVLPQQEVPWLTALGNLPGNCAQPNKGMSPKVSPVLGAVLSDDWGQVTNTCRKAQHLASARDNSAPGCPWSWELVEASGANPLSSVPPPPSAATITPCRCQSSRLSPNFHLQISISIWGADLKHQLQDLQQFPILPELLHLQGPEQCPAHRRQALHTFLEYGNDTYLARVV